MVRENGAFLKDNVLDIGWWRNKVKNTKFEARNSKQIQMNKAQNAKQCFEHLNLGFV